ncbi:YafY family protein [Paenibacillus sp.]|uniref:helix-turn-helix transcriptional regulator n=1 Tax=Paenibacillus sp. TaxID=58172 RepID=UPI002D3D9FED|nr:YafY family protein [Paenibacillus sp.]HZG84192.1 YafY family protein [Paenibacillus sp.]
MHKAQRLIQLMLIVNEKRRFTIRELSEELGVSRRTIMRDLGELEELGVPLYSEVGAAGGYRVLNDKMLPPIHFTDSEATALFFAGQSLQRYSELPFEAETASALRKFYARLPGDVRRRIDRLKRRLTFWVPPREVKAPHLRGLLEAALDRAVVEIEYDGAVERTVRRIRPDGVYAMNGLWYVQAYCDRSGGRRVFRADRVLSLSPAGGEPPEREEDAEPFEGPSFEPDDGQPLTLVVELTRAGMRRASADPWLSEGLMERPDGSGEAHRAIPPSYLPWATSFFLGYGPDARVVEPLELRRSLREASERVARMYEQDGR